MRLSPAAAAWILTAVCAIGLGAAVFRIPIQVSDSLEILETVDRAPSVTAAFVDALHASKTMLRPLRQTQTKILLDVSHALGNRYNMAFRGYHALSTVVLLVLFTWVVRPYTWGGTAALGFGLTVLVGMHTFDGMLREAYPINHFLLIAIYALATFALAQSRGGAAAEATACLLFILGALTLESGLVIWVVAVGGYLTGLRGISRRALVCLTLLGVGYLWLRVGYLHMLGNGVGERQTGFGADMLSNADLQARFGTRPWLIYGYTVLASILTVPLSQPVAGQWTVARAWLDGHLDAVYGIQLATSIAATALVGWYMAGTDEAGRRRWRQPLPAAMVLVTLTTAGLSYSYAKSEIMSAAGVFYALVATRAAEAGLTRLAAVAHPRLKLAALALVLAMSGAWAFRALGTPYHLQRAVFAARSEWVLRMPPFAPPPVPVDQMRLGPALRAEALARGGSSPFLLWPRYSWFWGD